MTFIGHWSLVIGHWSLVIFMSSVTVTTDERLHKAKGHKVGDLHPTALPIVVYDSVLETIIDFSEKDKSRELGGFLIGLTHESPEPHLEIRRFLPATGV